MLRETTLQELRAYESEYNFYSRYTNSMGLKFYLLSLNSLKVNQNGYDKQYYLKFLGIPKYRETYEIETGLDFVFAADVNLIDRWVLGDQIEKYFRIYGDYNFARSLNRLDSIDKFEEERIIVSSENERDFAPVKVNGSISPLSNLEDYYRREQDVENLYLTYCLQSKNSERYDHDFMLEYCFCDEQILNDVRRRLIGSGYIHQFFMELTPKGLGYLKERQTISENSKPTDSKIFFVAQSLNEEMIRHYEKVVKPLLESMGLRPVLIIREPPHRSWHQPSNIEYHHAVACYALSVVYENLCRRT